MTREADEGRAVQVPEAEPGAVVRERHRDEAGGREDRRDDDAAVERVDDRVLAASDAREERPDDRREDRDPAERERVQPEARVLERDAEEHHGDGGDRIGLEQVRRHAGAVADVVADVVGDHGRVPRVVLWDSRLDLPDEIRAHVRGLRVDAASETREDRDQRAAEGEADEVVHGRAGTVPDPAREHPVVAGHAEQPEADDEESRHGAGSERDPERGLKPLAGRLCRSDVRAHGDVHPDEAGRSRQERADEEAECDAPAQLVVEAEQEERRDRDDRDRRVLLAEVRGRALLDGAGDLAHPLVPGRLLEQPPGEIQPVQDRHGCAHEREPDGVVYEEVHGPPVLSYSAETRSRERRLFGA